MAKFDAYFALAKEKGVEVLELYYSRAKSLSFKLYNAQIEGYKLSEDISLYARGIYKGKIGYASTEKMTKETPEFLVNEIITNAGTVTKEELAIIFKGSEKYKKVLRLTLATATRKVTEKNARLSARNILFPWLMAYTQLRPFRNFKALTGRKRSFMCLAASSADARSASSL